MICPKLQCITIIFSDTPRELGVEYHTQELLENDPVLDGEVTYVTLHISLCSYIHVLTLQRKIFCGVSESFRKVVFYPIEIEL